MTTVIEEEALIIAQSQFEDNKKFLVLANRNWHPGIIGIVAARIVDKYNLPTAMISQAKDGKFRGSIRSNNKLRVNFALDECKDLLIAYGGHSAAAGFSIIEDNIPMLKERLNNIAKKEFKNMNLNKSITPDVHIHFNVINHEFHRQLQLIGPFGIMNPTPIFWTRKCQIIDIFKLKGDHLKMILNDGTATLEAVKWNGFIHLNKNSFIDIAFYIEINRWKNSMKFQLNILDIKQHKNIVDLQLHNKNYKCQLTEKNTVLVTNANGECLSSDLSSDSMNLNKKQKIFAKKLLSFAEIALGKAA